MKKLNWSSIGEIPKQLGYENHVGLANFLYGLVDNKFVVAGGSNFPLISNLDGGEKIKHKDLYIFTDNDSKIEILSQDTMEYNFSDGANIQVDNEIFYIVDNKILNVKSIDGNIQCSLYSEIPFSIYNSFGVHYNSKIYFGLGNINGEANTKIYSFDIEEKILVEITEIPFEKRSQSVVTVYKDELYIFGGGSSVAYTDGYKYSFKESKWSKIGNVEINGEQISVLGAANTKVGDKLLVIGGFNKEVWDAANYNLSTLEGIEKKAYREFYLNQPIEDYKWNKQVLCYDFSTNEWSSLGEISFDAPCGSGLVVYNDNLYSIMGEIRPGIRTKEVYKLSIKGLLD